MGMFGGYGDVEIKLNTEVKLPNQETRKNFQYNNRVETYWMLGLYMLFAREEEFIPTNSFPGSEIDKSQLENILRKQLFVLMDYLNQ